MPAAPGSDGDRGGEERYGDHERGEGQDVQLHVQALSQHPRAEAQEEPVRSGGCEGGPKAARRLTQQPDGHGEALEELHAIGDGYGGEPSGHDDEDEEAHYEEDECPGELDAHTTKFRLKDHAESHKESGGEDVQSVACHQSGQSYRAWHAVMASDDGELNRLANHPDRQQVVEADAGVLDQEDLQTVDRLRLHQYTPTIGAKDHAGGKGEKREKRQGDWELLERGDDAAPVQAMEDRPSEANATNGGCYETPYFKSPGLLPIVE